MDLSRNSIIVLFTQRLYVSPKNNRNRYRIYEFTIKILKLAMEPFLRNRGRQFKIFSFEKNTFEIQECGPCALKTL